MSADAEHAEREVNERDVRDGRAAIRSINFADAISEASRRYRRTLYALSIAAIVLSSHAIKITEIPWLSIPAPTEDSELIPSLLLVALAYQWLSFAMYGLADLIKWESGVSGEGLRAHGQLVHRLNNHLFSLQQAIEERAMRERGVTEERVTEVRERALRMAADAMQFYESFAVSGRRLTIFKRITAWGWEYAVPLVVGLWSGILLLDSLLE